MDRHSCAGHKLLDEGRFTNLPGAVDNLNKTPILSFKAFCKQLLMCTFAQLYHFTHYYE